MYESNTPAPQAAVSKTMTQVTNESSDKVAPQRSPCYLMAPFGWAAKPLAAMLEADGSLLRSLFTLSRQRMHLIALALAHWPGEIDAPFARLVMGGAPPMVLDAVLGRRPAGLKRALRHLPVGVLPRASYAGRFSLLCKERLIQRQTEYVRCPSGDVQSFPTQTPSSGSKKRK